MLKEDYPTWEAFLDRHVTLFKQIFYDVQSRRRLVDRPGVTQKERQMFFDTTAKRIDALGELEKEIWIIEVAARPGLRATGQLMTYLALWHQDPVINKPAIATLVCDFIDSDVEQALKFYGMQVRYPLSS